MLGACFFVVEGTVAGQERLPLSSAVARTLAANPAVRASRSSELEARERVTQALAAYMPNIDFTESWQRGNHPVFAFSSILSQRQFTAEAFALSALNHPASVNNFRIALTADQLLFDGGRAAAAVQAARVEQSLAAVGTRRLQADLALASVQAYGRVLLADAQARAAQAAVQSAGEDVQRAENRRTAGLETAAAVLALRVHLAQMHERRIRADSEMIVASADLNRLMGVPLDTRFDLDEPEPADVVETGEGAQRAVTPNRPELEQAVLRAELVKSQRATARSAFFPQIGLQAAFEMNGGTFGDRASAWIVGLQARWNIFRGFADRARVREAAHAVTRAAAERDRIEAELQLEVRSARAQLEAATAREAVGRAIVEEARESQRIIRDRYAAGLASITDVLRAATALLDAESQRINAIVDRMIAVASLNRAVGQMP